MIQVINESVLNSKNLKLVNIEGSLIYTSNSKLNM